MKNFFILSSRPNNVAKYKFKQPVYSFSDVVIFLNSGGKSQKIHATINGKSVTTFDFVYFRNWRKYESIATPLALCLKFLHVSFLDSEVVHNLVDSKSYEYTTFVLHNLPIPRTIIAHAIQMKSLETELEAFLSYPYIIKLSNAKQGSDNYLVNSHEELTTILKTYAEDDLFIAQKFIPNSYDFRLVMLGYSLACAYKRIRKTNATTHLNNVSRGARRIQIKDISTIKDLTILAEKASKLLRREICGVDIIIDTITQRPYLLEANSAPQLHYLPALNAVKRYLNTYE